MFPFDGRHMKLFIERHHVLVRSCGIFVSCILLSAFAYSKAVETGAFIDISAFTARATAFFLNLLGNTVQVSGVTIWSSDFSVDIGTGCTGLIPIMLFVCSVLAYPSRIRVKGLGIILGISCLYALNLLRTVSLFYIGSHFYSFFDTAHLLLWQSLIILAAIVLWLFWVRRTSHAQA